MSLLRWRKTKSDDQNGADSQYQGNDTQNQAKVDDNKQQDAADNTKSQSSDDKGSQHRENQRQNNTKTQKNTTKAATDAVDGQDLQAGRVYWFVLSALVLIILVTGVQNVKQVLVRHELYRALSQAKSEHQRLVTEEQRLLIEQQTFSATPIVAKRAKSELMMDYPRPDQHITILAPTTER